MYFLSAATSGKSNTTAFVLLYLAKFIYQMSVRCVPCIRHSECSLQRGSKAKRACSSAHPSEHSCQQWVLCLPSEFCMFKKKISLHWPLCSMTCSLLHHAPLKIMPSSICSNDSFQVQTTGAGGLVQLANAFLANRRN